MKKIISTILSITLLMCMSVTAFAADNEQTITVDIPDRDYTMTIPATTEIQYDSKDVVVLKNELKITSKNPTLLFSNNHYVQVDIKYTELYHKDNNKYTLPLSILYAKPANETNIQDGYDADYTWEELTSGKSIIFDANGDFYWENGHRLGAKVTSWDNAEPGEYQATVTYTATIMQK